MEYLITEEELRDLITKIVNKRTTPYIDLSMSGYVSDFLKSKQPVEEIFEGEYLIHSPEGSFENPDFWEAMSKINDAKKCKIFIQKETP